MPHGCPSAYPWYRVPDRPIADLCDRGKSHHVREPSGGVTVSAVVAQSQRNGVDVAELFATPDAVRSHPEAATFRFSVNNRWISGTHNRNQISTFYGVGAEQLRGRVRDVLRFSPALPSDRLAAIERLGFGRYEKVALRFDEPFWRAAGLPHAMIFPRDPEAAAVWAIGQDAFGAGPVLVFHVFHSATGHVLDVASGDATQWALDMLAEAIGHPCPAPVAVAVTSWANDPYSSGAYTHIPPGASPGDADLLGEPIADRVLFAGEHTQSARLAYADGAMTSGIREAKRLLGRSSVHLDPILAHGGDALGPPRKDHLDDCSIADP